MAEVIQTIRFKRGTKAKLEAQLTSTALGVLFAGEPAFETDTGQLKLGDGAKNYADLPYVGGESLDPRFVIQDPEANQVLLYDSTLGKWVNKDLADSQSLVYLAAHGLTIKGFADAAEGYMPTKKTVDGQATLVWIKPVDDAQMSAAVSQAQQYAVEAGGYKTAAGNSAVAADTSAKTAQLINNQTMAWVNNKFWWGTIEEYNALESISAGTYYFISATTNKN